MHFIKPFNKSILATMDHETKDFCRKVKAIVTIVSQSLPWVTDIYSFNLIVLGNSKYYLDIFAY